MTLFSSCNLAKINLFKVSWITFIFFFFLSEFSFTDTNNPQDSQGRKRTFFLFHSTISTHSETLRYLFATLHVRWLSRIFNRNAFVYQSASRWDLLPYWNWITIGFIDWWCNVCLFTWWIDSRWFYVTAIWHVKPVDSSSHRPSPLYYKQVY